MLRNDMTSTVANNGYFVVVTTIASGYLTAWDSNSDGYLDTTSSYAGSPTQWPSCIRISKTGTSISGYYSKDCSAFSLISTQSVSTATTAQDIGIYQTSTTGNLLSLSKFDYFILKTKVVTKETISLSTAETKSSDWEFYDNSSIVNNTTLTSTLLSNSNTSESYQESNPTLLNPNQITNVIS